MKIAVLKAAKTAAEALSLIKAEHHEKTGYWPIKSDWAINLDGTDYPITAVISRVVQKFELGETTDPWATLVSKGLAKPKVNIAKSGPRAGKPCGFGWILVPQKPGASPEDAPKF